MFAVVDIMRMYHPLQISGALSWTPTDTLMNDDVVEDQVKNTVHENAYSDGYQIRTLVYAQS